MSTAPQASPPELSAPALREWTYHVECILRGLAHALNNRAAALSALYEFSREPDLESPADTREILDSEMRRVQELVKAVRAIGSPGDGIESIVPAELLDDVRLALDLHADLRERSVSFEATGAPPVRARRWMLLRALIALAAKTVAPPQERRITIALAEEGEWLAVRITGGARSAPDAAYAWEMARAMGGEPLAEGRGFRIPTLAALRQREGR